MNNDILNKLRELPEFQALEKRVHETIDSNLNHFRHNSDGYIDEKDDDGKQICYNYHLSDNEVDDLAKEEFTNDTEGYFSDYVMNDVADETVELARVLIKEILK